MLSNFPKSLSLSLTSEGGYVDDPRDPGGATNHGITIGTLRQLAIDVDGDGDSDLADLKALRPSDLERVYRTFYWNPLQGDLLPAGPDYAAFDAGIMSGVSRAARWLQGTVGADQDGAVGPHTLTAVRAVPPSILVHGICNARLAFCKVAKDQRTGALLWPVYGNGWQKRIDRVRADALAMVMP